MLVDLTLIGYISMSDSQNYIVVLSSSVCVLWFGWVNFGKVVIRFNDAEYTKRWHENGSREIAIPTGRSAIERVVRGTHARAHAHKRDICQTRQIRVTRLYSLHQYRDYEAGFMDSI